MEYPPETRAAAVGAVKSGRSVNSVAKEFRVSRTTVTHWCDVADRPAATLVQQEKKQAIGEQVYGLVEEYLETLRVQTRVARDEDWLKKQSASDLAILHGVLSDKAVRLLSAFQPADDSE